MLVIINVQLSVKTSEGTLSAHLSFENKSGQMIYLNKQVTYYDGEVLNNYFRILDTEGGRVRYKGMMANCTRKPEEYIAFHPGAVHNSVISLSDHYRLGKGMAYTIQYYAYNPWGCW